MTARLGADDRRKEIIREAAGLFEKSGYFNTSMDDIALAVGLRKPTLYHYVSSKEEILFMIHEEFIDHLTNRFTARLDTRMSNPQMLLEVLIDILEQIAQCPGYVRAFFEHHRDLSGDMKQKIASKRDAYFQMVANVIRQGVESGEFETHDVTLSALTFFGMCNYTYHWYDPKGRRTPREIADHFWDLFMKGVANPAR